MSEESVKAAAITTAAESALTKDVCLLLSVFFSLEEEHPTMRRPMRIHEYKGSFEISVCVFIFLEKSNLY